MLIKPKKVIENLKKFYPNSKFHISLDYSSEIEDAYYLHYTIKEDFECEEEKECKYFDSWESLELYAGYLVGKCHVYNSIPDEIEI